MYLPLNIKTDNYLQSSMIKINDLILFAKEHNITSLTITDNNMYGVIDFYKECIKNNIKPVIGLEINLDTDIIVLYAKNYDGYLNLIKLSTILSKENITIDILKKYNNDLIAIIPYGCVHLLDKLKIVYYDYFISYKNESEKSQVININNRVYMNSVTCLNKVNTKDMRYLEAIRDGVGIKFISTDYSDNYIKLEEEIPDDLIALKNNYWINNNCNVELRFNQELMPVFLNSDSLDSYSYLKKLCIIGAKKRFGVEISRKYQDRLKYELNVINKMGFCDYFLIVQDYVNYAKNNNIIVGSGRGSAVGSLVAYLLNITDVDPLKYDLLFERFLNPERISMPDIDIDFEADKRDEVINYCINKYGVKKVAPIIAFGTLGAKAAIRDIGRCLEISLSSIDALCKLIDSKLTLKQNYDLNKKLRELLDRKPDLFHIYKTAFHFEGLKRHTTIHAAGIVMSRKDLDDVIPLSFHNEFYTSGYDMTYLEEIGLLKMDFLAIKYLTTIHKIIDLVNLNHKTNLKFDNININDEKVIDIFKNADTLGIFQFESSGMINFLSRLQPNSFDDIVASIALYRPGPMKNIPSYINRKNGKEKIDYICDDLKDILKSTYGIIIYQEQIMQIAQIMASYTLGEADILRKAMSKKNKKLLEQQQEIFKTRSLKNGYDIETTNRIYELMLKFAEYGFNKSHSVGYSYIACKMAYLKAYYRKEFYTCLLESEKGSREKTKQYIYELKKYNITVYNPDINKSTTQYDIIDNKIIYPLTFIKGINKEAAEIIIKERQNGLYKDIYNFLSRCYSKIVNKKVVESLILSGTFDNLNINRNTLYSNIDIIINYGELLKDLGSYALKPEIDYKNEYSKKEIMRLELEYLGIYLQNNPLALSRQKYHNTVMLKDIDKYFNKNIEVIVIMDKIKEIDTKNNQKMAFLTVSDEITTSSITLFPKVYRGFNLNVGDIVYIIGRVEKRFDKYQIIANSIKKLDTE